MYRNQQDLNLKDNHINIQIKEMGKRKKKKEKRKKKEKTNDMSSVKPLIYNRESKIVSYPDLSNHLLSSRSTCMAAYARTTNILPKMARPMQSRQRAITLKPKELRMAEPGTSISRPYLWSTRLRYLTSLTMRPSKA